MPHGDMMGSVPKRRWFRKKRWWAALLLYLFVLYPLSSGGLAYCAGRGWVSSGMSARVVPIYDPLLRVLEAAPVTVRGRTIEAWWRKWNSDLAELGVRHFDESVRPERDDVIGASLVGVAQTAFGKAEYKAGGIGPERLRSHYVALDSDLTLHLAASQATIATVPDHAGSGTTVGIAADELIGCRVTALVRDEANYVLLVFEGGVFLKDDFDEHGNLLLAGRLSEQYADRPNFTDFWTGKPVRFD